MKSSQSFFVYFVLEIWCSSTDMNGTVHIDCCYSIRSILSFELSKTIQRAACCSFTLLSKHPNSHPTTGRALLQDLFLYQIRGDSFSWRIRKIAKPIQQICLPWWWNQGFNFHQMRSYLRAWIRTFSRMCTFAFFFLSPSTSGKLSCCSLPNVQVEYSQIARHGCRCSSCSWHLHHGHTSLCWHSILNIGFLREMTYFMDLYVVVFFWAFCWYPCGTLMCSRTHSQCSTSVRPVEDFVVQITSCSWFGYNSVSTLMGYHTIWC